MNNVMKLPNKAILKLDIIKAFGADFDQEIKDSLFFVSENTRAIVYPVGHHIAIRDLFVREEIRRNDIMFIYQDVDVKKITAMNVTRDHNLILVCEKKVKVSCIAVYNLMKLNFNSVTYFKPKRKIISSVYSEFIYASFSLDENYIACIGVIHNKDDNNSSTYHGVVWDIQIFQSYKEDNYKPKCVFDLPSGVNKITIENKIICTSGNCHLSFWYIYENSVKEFKSPVKGLNMNKFYIDHEWILGKIPTIVAISDDNDVYIIEGFNESQKKDMKRVPEDDDIEGVQGFRVDKFILKQHIVNCFCDHYINACIVKPFSQGIIIGSAQGHLLFIEKPGSSDSSYQIVRYTSRERQAKVTGITFSSGDEYMVVGFNSNEIASIHILHIFDNLRNINYDIKFNVVCDGFHQGPISAMDVALQRPIIVTTSQADKTIRIWNYLTGHCEYCKIILTEKENNIEKEMDILSVAIHPNGYYLAISDKEMIRFFHICYRELRFYNNDSNGIEIPKSNCHILKFSYGGHLLAAVSGKMLYIIRSYTRETIKTFETPHSGSITQIVFNENDYFVYTIGMDGAIFEYNLFTFHVDKISSKSINYTGGAFCQMEENGTTSIVACGMQNANKYAITEVNMSESGYDFSKIADTFVTSLDQKVYSTCRIKSKKFDISSLAGGTEDGMMYLYPYPLSVVSHPGPWDCTKSHRSAITSISFSRDTNLLFSAGMDGNIFIYCIYECPDGQMIFFDDNKIDHLSQLNSILDEGLGDNVLFPLASIYKYEDEIQNHRTVIAECKKQEEKVKFDQANILKERESELTRKRELDVRELTERLSEIKISKEATIDHYEERIKQIEDDHRKILLEKSKDFNERLDELSNTIATLTGNINKMLFDHQVELRRKDDECEKRFEELECELKKKFEDMRTSHTKLQDELQTRQQHEEMKILYLDQEHEQEISSKILKYETTISKLEKEKLGFQNENTSLKELKIKLEQEIQEKENINKKLIEENERQFKIIQNLRVTIDSKENEKEVMKKKLKKSEESFQEKEKYANFSNTLKRELYLKNIEVMSNFNKQQSDHEEMKTISKSIEKELEESFRLLEKKEKELQKQQVIIDEMKEKYEQERIHSKHFEKEFDGLLQKIYDIFQSNDKNKLIEGLRMIYSKYLTEEAMGKIVNAQINVNIKEELEKHIDFLQKGIMSVNEDNGKREKIQQFEIVKKVRENSILIDELNTMRKNYVNLEKAFTSMKSDYSAAQKKLEKYSRMEREDKMMCRNPSPSDAVVLCYFYSSGYQKLMFVEA